MQATKLFNKNFTLLFQGQLVSQVGSAAYILALTFWLKHATGSATLKGLFSMAALIPGVLLGPLGGTFADHFSRKKIIVVGDPVLLHGNFAVFSAPVVFASKAPCAGNGRSPWQARQRGGRAPRERPAGCLVCAHGRRCTSWQGLRPFPASCALP